MNSWQIATTATAITGFADTAVGAGPMLFNVAAFDTDDGTPLPLYGDPDNLFTFSHGQGQSGDAPADAGNMSWTDYSGDTNDDTRTVRDIIRGETSLDVTLDRPVRRPAQQRRARRSLRRGRHLAGGHGYPGPDRRRERHLPGLGDLPRHERQSLRQDGHRLLQVQLRRAAADDPELLDRRRLPGVPRIVHPEARELEPASPHRTTTRAECLGDTRLSICAAGRLRPGRALSPPWWTQRRPLGPGGSR